MECAREVGSRFLSEFFSKRIIVGPKQTQPRLVFRAIGSLALHRGLLVGHGGMWCCPNRKVYQSGTLSNILKSDLL